MITVLCPTYNEIKNITGLMKYFIDVNPSDKELIIIDGGSTDGTRECVLEGTKEHQNIRLLDNPDKYVPFALNLGIKESKGEIIVRIDAHSIYAEDYFTEIIKTFERTGADIVGGPTRILVENDFDEAINYVLKHKFGTGDNKLHNEDFRGYTEHVTFGAWKRSIFSDLGYFNEKLVRNQDDEFHYRAYVNGKKIFLEPEIKLWYKPRQNLIALFKQYFQYGLYKPLVLSLTKKASRIRHFIPALFAAYLVSLPVFVYSGLYFSLIPLIIYIISVIAFSFKSSLKFKMKILTALIFGTLHIAYGLGFILGMPKSLNFIRHR